MGFKFRKSLRFSSGFKLNFSRRGVSASRIPDNPEGRKIFLEFTRDILNFRQPVISNTINGDNTGNQISVVNN